MIINLYKTKIQWQQHITYKNVMESIYQDAGIGYNTICRNVQNHKKIMKWPNKKNCPTFNDFDKNTIRQKKYKGFGLRMRYQH